MDKPTELQRLVRRTELLKQKAKELKDKIRGDNR
jgi:hypothetical protein